MGTHVKLIRNELNQSMDLFKYHIQSQLKKTPLLLINIKDTNMFISIHIKHARNELNLAMDLFAVLIKSQLQIESTFVNKYVRNK